jgi:hypothetical protein
MPTMNCHKQFAILIIWMAAAGALAQSTSVTQATVCDIVNNQLQFEGKLVQVRAQIRPDIYRDRQFWINEVTMKSGKICDFLKARIIGPTSFAGANGFGTFTGRLVRDSMPPNFEASGSKVRLVFIVEQESDVYGLEHLNGPVPVLQLYDKQTGTFIKPQRHIARVVWCNPARPVPGTSKMNVNCFDTNLPASYDVWSTMIFQP